VVDVVEYQLTGNSSTTSSNNNSIVVDIGKVDLDNIKALALLAVGDDSAYMAGYNRTIKDMSGNELMLRSPTPVCPADLPCPACNCAINNVKVTTFVADTTVPTLDDVSLSMDGTGLITLSFSETVNSSSFAPQMLTVQSQSATDGSTESHVFSAGTVDQVSNTVLTYTPTIASMNDIKFKRKLANGASSSFFAIETGTVADMVGNLVVNISASSAKQTNDYTADSTRPILASFDFDLDLGMLTAVFDETVDAGTLRAGFFVLQNNVTASSSHVLTGGNLSTIDSTVVQINMTIGDLNEIKKKTMLATANTTTFLRIGSAAVNDTAANQVVPVSDGSAVAVSTYTADTTAPVLVSYDLNMHTGVVLMTFSETVNASSVEIGAFVLQSTSSSDLVNVTLAGALSSTTDSTLITVVLSDDCLNAIKLQSSLATSDSTTFLTMPSTSMSDMAANPVAALVTSAAKAVTTFTADAVGASVTGVFLDMDALTLTLNFSETMNASSLDVTQIEVQSDADYTSADSVQLSTSSSSSSDGLAIVIGLSVYDANRIKAFDTLATVSTANAYVSLTNATIVDMNGVANVAVSVMSAKRANTFVADGTAPTLSQFDLNMTSEELVLRFSETVRANTLKVTGLTLQSNTTLPGAGHSYQLTNGTVSTVNSDTVTVSLTTADIDAIKALTTLCTRSNNTFLVVNGSAIQDMRGNGLTAVTDGAAKSVTTFTVDSTSPTLVSVQALMPTAKPPMVLVATFSETVLVSSLNTSAFVLQEVGNNSAGSANSFRLGASTVSSSSATPTVVTITMSASDLVQLKLLASVGRDQSNMFVSLDAGGITDHASNPVIEVPSSAAQQVSVHTVDITPPVLSSFDMDMTAGTVSLVFSEDVVLSTFNVTNLVIQSIGNSTAVSHQLTGGSKAAGSANDIVVVTLTESDTDILKAARTLAIDNATTFISFVEGTVFDYAENAVTAVTASAATGVSTYTKDSDRPELLSFDLNMTDGTMSFTFDEVVMASSLSMGSAKLQSSTKPVCTLPLSSSRSPKRARCELAVAMVPLTPGCQSR
jgi:hypothetical protein